MPQSHMTVNMSPSEKMVCLPLIVLWLGLAGAMEFKSIAHIKSKTSDIEQTATVREMAARVTGERAKDFVLIVNSSMAISNKDTYQLETVDSKLQITGSSGIAVAMGFYFYLKYYCNSQFTWGGQNINLPDPLPAVKGTVTTTAQDRFRYYQNVCTVSYSFAFWDWERWERHIDWMALNGINLPLAFTGQEAIFQRLYMNMGISNEDLEGFFGGPAFLAWSRMGNIQGWGGPLPQMWITNQLLLQHRILQRMRGFGMVPVLPAFAGHVPASFTKVFPQAKVTRLGGWSRFNSTYSYTYLLDFNDPLFKVIGATFIQLMNSEFGVDHIYNADTFNEMTPASSSTSYLASAGEAVYKAMLAGDPDAVWLMQGWLFMDSNFWKPPQIKALLTSVPLGRMIILDLFAELSPVYQRTESFYGQPFIWCMLHNFGGTMELYGALDNLNNGPSVARKFNNSTMIGTGLTPEGIFQNEVIYEFMNENAWRDGPRDIDSWLASYIQQRYNYTSSAVIEAWYLLKQSVYNCTDGHGDGDRVLITERPQLNYDVSANVWYDPEMLFTAWDNLLEASADFNPNELFIYDLVDVTRNSLQILSLSYYSSLIKAYNARDTVGVREYGMKMVELLMDMDTLLASDKHFLLGRWLADAASWGTDMAEKFLMLYNARNQITLWGPSGEIVDYASKQWSGLFKDYYAPRWMFFSDWLAQLIENGTKFDNYIFVEHIMKAVETPFTLNLDMYTTNATGNSLSLARELHDKYRPESRKEFFQLLPKTSTSLTFSSRGKSKAFKQRYQKGLLSMLHSGRDQEFGMSGW
ncbi:alpha-N-acetylglucosaminidase-like isoform X2 [Pomacea canaliculata]|uniref:alpha-N-acetylglucosaminidase-like isoform X2 n=1 Tax=Pomacea canaliculata TaxID=400727 RepID=UPI000D730557|nr:alpha-N-acetylglucosaminidase-like isoform X2 [Pomacea canaliculata]